MDEYRMVIGGEKRASAEKAEVFNPANGSLVGLSPVAALADLDDAVTAAAAAFPGWSRQPDEARAAACLKAADLIEANAEALARLLTLEQGKPLNGLGSRFEMGGSLFWTRTTAGIPLPVEVLQDDERGRIELHRKPHGVVGSITPWNFPVMIALWHMIPAIRAGNTVVIKPSPYTPLATLRLVEIVSEAFPKGVVNVVTGGPEIGAAMSAHPGIAKIIFTGSSATGRSIMASAAGTLKALTLELGGNDAGIVLPDADPEAIAEGLFWGAFINTGQTCGALKRLYVHDSLHDRVCAALAAFAKKIPMGDGLDEANLLGPIQNKMQLTKLQGLLADALAQGGEIIGGGGAWEGPGLFQPVTFVAGLSDGHRLVDEEQFGTVLPIIRYEDPASVVATANRNPNGLGGSLWTSTPAAWRDLALELECGTVWINKHGAIQPDVPFGGVKASGLGVEFGEEGMKACTTIRVLHC